MKNIRQCKELGLQTLLITCSTGRHSSEVDDANKHSDTPVVDDPSVDAFLQTVRDMKRQLPGLWSEKILP